MMKILGALVLLSLAPVAGAASPGQQDSQIFMRMLEQRCISCHGPDKRKGKLRLDTSAGIASVIEPYVAPESKLFLSITRAHDDLDRMPAEGDPCTDAEILAVLHWINAGAPMEQIAAHIEKRREASSSRESGLGDLRLATGALVREVATGQPGATGLMVDYARCDTVPSAAALVALAAKASALVELSFAGQPIGSSALQNLPAMPALERLHLERTGVDDGALELLVAKAPALRYLNLHSTAVTANGLAALTSLTKLERLILFETPLGEEQLASLRAALPGVEVSADLALPLDPFTTDGPRKLLLADASKGRIALLREIGLGKYDLLWEHSIKQIHDLHMLDNGHVLFQESWTQLVEVDISSGETVWSYDAAQRNREQAGEPVEVHAFQRLPGGITMIVESGPARIIEVDKAGEITFSLDLQVTNPSAHSDTRLARKTAAGTYLVAHERDGVVREYNATGEVIWSFAVPLFERERSAGHGPDAWGNQLFCALRLASGNTMITTGNGHGLLEVDPSGQIVWHLKQDDLEGIRLAWVTTIQVLSNGNLILGNCHAGPDQPQLIEINRDKEVLWTFQDMDRFGNSLSNAWVIEDVYRNVAPAKSDGD